MSKREVTAEDYLRQAGSFDPATQKEDIEAVPRLDSPEVELDIFMNELVTVLVHESTDTNATPAVEVSVNGRRVIVPRGIPMRVKRMYVERLARAKRITYSQDLNPALGEDVNRVQRHRGLDYPFSVVEDKNPLGNEWLQRVLQQS